MPKSCRKPPTHIVAESAYVPASMTPSSAKRKIETNEGNVHVPSPRCQLLKTANQTLSNQKYIYPSAPPPPSTEQLMTAQSFWHQPQNYSAEDNYYYGNYYKPQGNLPQPPPPINLPQNYSAEDNYYYGNYYKPQGNLPQLPPPQGNLPQPPPPINLPQNYSAEDNYYYGNYYKPQGNLPQLPPPQSNLPQPPPPSNLPPHPAPPSNFPPHPPPPPKYDVGLQPSRHSASSIKNNKSTKSKKTCKLCNEFCGVYSELCPGKNLRINCLFFLHDGNRKLCGECRNIQCDGGENGEYCRLTRKVEDLRMLEELAYEESLVSKDHHKIPPPPPIDNLRLKDTVTCTWNVDEDNRIITADFSGARQRNHVTTCDLKSLLELMEMTDIVVKTIGLADSTNLSSALGSSHLIDVLEQYHEYMLVKDEPLTSGTVKESVDERTWEICNEFGTLESVLKHHKQCKDAAGKRKIYLLDYPVDKILPLLRDFNNNFLIKEILPGGNNCLFSSVGYIEGENFFGPLMYIAVGGGCNGTYFHEDGHGTVDSGHLCLSGYNEVIILRRLEGHAREYAAKLLGIDLHSRPNVVEEGNNRSFKWPTTETIQKLKEYGCAPILLILGPGEHIHINKSRLHAFRKCCFKEPLPPDDCCYGIRQNLKNSLHQNDYDDRCVSIAWDWMFQGYTAIGTARELSMSLKRQFYHSNLGREEDRGEQIIGKAMYPIAIRCIIICRGLECGRTKVTDTDLNFMRGILPILNVAKYELEAIEKFIEKRTIMDESEEEEEERDRYECACCFGELWCYYVEAFSLSERKKVCVCAHCFQKKKEIFHKKKGYTYWKRLKNMSSQRLDEMIQHFKEHLDENKNYWWETMIHNKLLSDYNKLIRD